ncbi:MAG: VanW family protein [Peptococcaceae bacterium]|nr:VanW family protein [Peptococcaceae bacterium]
MFLGRVLAAVITLLAVTLIPHMAEAAVMVPLRQALDGNGFYCTWDGTHAGGIGMGHILKIIPGERKAILDGQEVAVDAPAALLDGRLYVSNQVLYLMGLKPIKEMDFCTTVVMMEGRAWVVGIGSTASHYLVFEASVAEQVYEHLSVSPGTVWILPEPDPVLAKELLEQFSGTVEPGSDATLVLPHDAVEQFTTALVEKKTLIKIAPGRLLGACTVNFTPCTNMLNAVKAAEYLNGTEVAPGEVFSYNRTVGPRTAARGFVVGTAISNGKYVHSMGGGVCRTSTVLYGAVLNAGLPVVEHHPHSIPVHYVPAGRDATVSWGAADLKFRNSRSRAIWIEAGGTVRQLTVKLWEVPGVEQVAVMPPIGTTNEEVELVS